MLPETKRKIEEFKSQNIDAILNIAEMKKTFLTSETFRIQFIALVFFLNL